jgi:predicted peroxiredoxin
MNILFIINTDDAEIVYNAMHLANIVAQKGDKVNVFMLGKAVCFEQINSEAICISEGYA